MDTTTAIDTLFNNVFDTYRKSGSERFIILIGGCSRSGKSTIAHELNNKFIKNGVKAVLVNLDSWLISVDKRKPDSTVSERYELTKINLAVDALLKGQTVYPPVYDPVSRKRLDGRLGTPLKIEEGVLIIDGVVALSDSELLQKSHMRIFVDVSDTRRMKRLIHFYRDIKKLKIVEYKKIIFEREQEEVPFVKRTSVNADIIFVG